MGSSALFGQLSESDLSTTASDGRSLISMHGRRRRRRRARQRSAKLSWIQSELLRGSELHIEQGPVLLARNLPVGIVTGIRGNIRHRAVTCVGQAGHSGAVPRWLRHDAVFATAELITHLDRHWRTLLERGRDVVVTSGILRNRRARARDCADPRDSPLQP